MKVSLYARPVMGHEVEQNSSGIALVAHDACKQAMIEWARYNRTTLSSYTLYTTGTTGALIATSRSFEVHNVVTRP